MRLVEIIGRKTCGCQRDLVAVIRQPFDVVGRIVILARPLGHSREVKEAVEANGHAQ